jgi:glycosyltransferase involved in cell wall biosynthesis
MNQLASKSILLSSRVDGLGDFLTNSNSIDCGYTKDSISTALKYFTNISQHQKESMIKNGLQTCNSYKWDDIADEYYNIYKSLI